MQFELWMQPTYLEDITKISSFQFYLPKAARVVLPGGVHLANPCHTCADVTSVTHTAGISY